MLKLPIIFIIIGFKMHNEHNLPAHLRDTESRIIGHMSIPEIEELSRIQGGRHIDPETKYPSFMPLGEVFQHQRFRPYYERFKSDYMSKNTGGYEGLEGAIRKAGRFGDTEAVILPRVLADLFDEALYGGRQPGNPHTGKREYFLGGMLSSIGNFLSPITSQLGSFFKSAAPAIGQFASPLISKGLSALGQKAGLSPELSESLGSSIGNTASSLLSNYGNSGGEAAPGTTAAAGGEGGVAAQQGAPQQQSALDILKQGAGNILRQSLPSISNAVGGKAQELGNKVNPTFGTGLGNLTSSLINNVGGNVSGSLEAGQNPDLSSMGNTALDTVTSNAREQIPNIQNPLARAGAEGGLNSFEAYRGGAEPMEALSQGMGGISPENMEGAQNYAKSGISGLLDSILPELAQDLPFLAA
jgi:hypothetical protein